METSRLSTVMLALVLGGCASGVGTTPTPPLLPPGTVVSEGVPQAMTTVTPSGGGTAGTAVPANGSAPQTPGLTMPATQMAPIVTDLPSGPNVTPANMMMPPPGCMPGQVSYSRPCSSEPDPCGLKSGWSGDEYCLKPPAPDEGVQIHFGPKDYADKASEYVIQPGAEFDDSVLAHVPLTEAKWWDHIRVQMRPGSHHWISYSAQGQPREGFYLNSVECNGAGGGGGVGGGQNLIYDNPPDGKQAPENEGLGRQIPGNSSLCLNLHSYNLSNEARLREIWINLYFVDAMKVTKRAGAIAMVGGTQMNVLPHTNQTLMYDGNFSGDGHIIQLFGHRHMWTPRFAAWLNDTLIYDSWSWRESVTFNYDSLTTNPAINTDAKTDGAVSGPQNFKSGDRLRFACFIENTSATTLKFKNDIDGGEMCNMWGSTVGGSIPFKLLP